jgi:hypothetical protein
MVVNIPSAAMVRESVIYRQPGLPAFQNRTYPDRDDARRAVVGDVELVQDARTGLVHNQTFDEALLTYDADYQNEQACSPTFRRHLEEVLHIVLRNFPVNAVGVEIGCGKGYFLELMLAAGADVTGYDPAYQGTNPRVVAQYFGDTPLTSVPDYVILRHVLEHISMPWEFLKTLSAQCNTSTKVYIEVPCFDWIVNHCAFYDIFYEHVNYFTLDVLNDAFPRAAASGHFFGGQYLYIVADLASYTTPTHFSGRRFATLQIDQYLADLLRRRRNQARPVVIWGAGAKGVTLSNILVRRGIAVDVIVDINPAKQHRYSGGAGLPIVAPGTVTDKLMGADIFVMNPIYLSEIQAMTGGTNANLIPVA